MNHLRQFVIFRSLFYQTSLFRYHIDGSGGDSFVLGKYNGLVKIFELLAKKILENIFLISD